MKEKTKNKGVSQRYAYIKQRIAIMHRKAKICGLVYLFGTIGLVIIAVCMPLITGTCITADGATMPILTFYQPIVNFFANGIQAFSLLTAAQMIDLIMVLLFAVMLLIMSINVLRSIGKLGWLFKRRASYLNGFNRNMYAMDEMANRFSNSLYTLVVIHLFMYLFSSDFSAAGQETTLQITMNAYIVLGLGFGLHFICGLIGGTVTLFSTGGKLEEETRKNGLFVFFVRNLIQIATVVAIVYFLLQESILVVKIQEFLKLILEEKKPLAEIDWMRAIPAGTELLAWIFIAVLAGHAIADTEFNRDGVVGAGMRNFAIFAFLTALALAACIALPMLGIGVADKATELNQNLLIAAAVAFVAFLLDCIIRPRMPDNSNCDNVDIEAYFQDGEQTYNNTII